MHLFGLMSATGLVPPLAPVVRTPRGVRNSRLPPLRAALEEPLQRELQPGEIYGSKRAVVAGLVPGVGVSLKEALREYERKQLYKQRWRDVCAKRGFLRRREARLTVQDMKRGLEACGYMCPDEEELLQLVQVATWRDDMTEPEAALHKVNPTVDFMQFIWVSEQFCEALELCELDLSEDNYLAEDTLRGVFDEIDSGSKGGGDGFLSARELGTVLATAGVRAPPIPVLREIVASYDVDRDGQLSFDEFQLLAEELNRERQADLSAAALVDRMATTTAAEAQMMAGVGVGVAADEAPRDEAADAKALQVGAGLSLMDEQVKAFFVREGAFDEPLGVQQVQDALYRRFRARYVDRTDGRAEFEPAYLGVSDGRDLSDEQRALLAALRDGDVAAIRELMRIDWNFVYPPADYTTRGGGPTNQAGERAEEGWCRSPLALLVRPDEGNFGRFLPGVSREDRLALIEAALASGCADPNYPRLYWSGPAAHACFEGDVEALALLDTYGCDLSQRVEWVLQPSARFSLVHAAAFNGNKAILEYLLPRVPAELARSVDADGSNALHTLLESSRDLETARFLLEAAGCDGFATNKMRRSPLSMAIEELPPLAEELLRAKYRFEYRWWGNDLYWYSFDGVVLPCTDEGKALPLADAAGKSTCIEELIIVNKRKELLKLPVMRTILERKWRWFVGTYQREVLQYVAMVAGIFAASVSDVGTPAFAGGTALALGAWGVFMARELTELAAKGPGPFVADKLETQWPVRRGLNVLDATHLLLLPAIPLVKLAAAQGLVPAPALLALAPVASVLQITLSLRALQYISLFRSLGPLLVTVVSMFSDTASFAGIYAFVLFAFSNALFVVLSASPGVAEGLDYRNILEQQLLWLLGSIDLGYFDLLDPTPALKTPALALFWTYTLLSSFILLNLLIAIFNSTYERVSGDRDAEWLWLRLEAMLSFESDLSVAGLDEYYTELQELNNQRTVDKLDKPVQPVGGS